MKKRNKLFSVSTRNLAYAIVLLAITFAVLVTGVTYAIWTTTATASKDVELPVNEYNPSLKYLVFRGLTSEGAFTTDALAVSYAVVGYEGLVAEVIIPDKHNSLPVTRICIDPAQANKAFAGNPIVTSLFIPDSVTTIAAGACENMDLLSSVTIESGATSLSIGALAFANCPLLTTFETSSRTITGDRSSYLLGTAVE